MTDFEKQEFWAALGRPYSTTVELTKLIEAQTAQIEAQRLSIADLFQVASAHQIAVTSLHDTAAALRDTAATHEKRLDR